MFFDGEGIGGNYEPDWEGQYPWNIPGEMSPDNHKVVLGDRKPATKKLKKS